MQVEQCPDCGNAIPSGESCPCYAGSVSLSAHDTNFGVCIRCGNRKLDAGCYCETCRAVEDKKPGSAIGVFPPVSEYEKAHNDLINFGTAFMLDGKRIDPRSVRWTHGGSPSIHSHDQTEPASRRASGMFKPDVHQLPTRPRYTYPENVKPRGAVDWRPDRRIEAARIAVNSLVWRIENKAESAMEAANHIRKCLDMFQADERPPTPVDMVLHCPACKVQHIDKAEETDPATWTAERHGHWTNPPHKTHRCAACGHEWRPANVPTNGVEKLA